MLILRQDVSVVSDMRGDHGNTEGCYHELGVVWREGILEELALEWQLEVCEVPTWTSGVRLLGFSGAGNCVHARELRLLLV